MELIYPPYNPDFDYFTFNLDFDLKHPSSDFHKHDRDHIMEIHYALHETRMAKGWHRHEYLEFCCNLKTEFYRNLTASVMYNFKKINSKQIENDESMYAFITVGWNEQTVTPQKMLAASQNILNLKYFTTAYMVLEKHRENGVHHHTHYLVEFCEKYPLSKIIGWIYQTRGVKDLCLNKNFIDYLGSQNGKKPYQTYQQYYEYIHGNKQEKKLPFIELDKKWRLENKIEDIYSR